MKILICLAILFIGSIIGYLKWPQKNKSSILPEYERIFLETLPEINRLWHRAKWSDAPECKALLGLNDSNDQQMISCHPIWLNCVLQSKAFKVEEYTVRPVKKSNLINGIDNFLKLSNKQISSNFKNSLYYLDLEVEGNKKRILLENSCHQVYLPQRTYLDENSDRSNSQYWDNLGRYLYIDRYMFKNWELAYLTNKSIELKEAMKTNLGLSFNQKKELCLRQGKRILTSRLFNAATTPPIDLSESNPRFLKNSFDPWSKYESKSVLNLDNNEDNIEKICSQFKFKNCDGVGIQNLASWMGMKDLFIGVSHQLENNFYPEETRAAIHDQKYFEKGIHLFSREKETDKSGFRCYQELIEEVE